jgi:hypothetical protein
MTTILLVLGLLWLLALTLLVAAIVRHLATFRVTALAAGGAPTGFSFDTDGPWIPSALPLRASEAFDAAGVSTDDFVAAFFAASCKSCLKRAEDIARRGVERQRTVFLITGNHPEGLDNLGAVLGQTGAPLLFDPDAHDIVKSLEINSTPFAFRVSGREIVAKTYIRSVEDLVRISAPELSDKTPEVELQAIAVGEVS